MKKFRPLLIITIFTWTVFAACKKEETLDRSNTAISLVGKWVMTASYQDVHSGPYWENIEAGDEPWVMEFTSDGKHSTTQFPDLVAYKISAPGELMLQSKTDGEWHPFRYFATKSGELIIHPSGGKYACYDGYGCLIKFKRAI